MVVMADQRSHKGLAKVTAEVLICSRFLESAFSFVEFSA